MENGVVRRTSPYTREAQTYKVESALAARYTGWLVTLGWTLISYGKSPAWPTAVQRRSDDDTSSDEDTGSNYGTIF